MADSCKEREISLARKDIEIEQANVTTRTRARKVEKGYYKL